MGERKVWEEEWRVHPQHSERVCHRADPNWEDERAPHGTFCGEYMRLKSADWPEVTARARLAACAPEMARMLVELERVGWSDDIGCPSCGAESPDVLERLERMYPNTRLAHGMTRKELIQNGGHMPDCRLLALLRKAGVHE